MALFNEQAELSATTEECDSRNNYLLSEMILDPNIRDRTGKICYTLSNIEIHTIYFKITHDRLEPLKTFFLSVLHFVYLYSKFIRQNNYQRNVKNYAWGPANAQTFLETMCSKSNIAFMSAMVFANYSNLSDEVHKYIDDVKCLFELPDFANRANVLYKFITGEIKYKGQSFDYYYKQEGSVIAKQLIPIVVDYRMKTFSIRQENFLLFQQQKVVNQSSQLKNVDNAFNRWLYKSYQMVSIESTIVDMYGSNCFVNGTAFWYFITYRFLDVYIHRDDPIKTVIQNIARTDDHYKTKIKADNKNKFELPDEEYSNFLSKLVAFKDIIVNSPQKYTYGTIPLLWYIYLNQCYDIEGSIDEIQVDLFCDKIYTYATLNDYAKIWINRQTQVPGVLFTKQDVVDLLEYEAPRFINTGGSIRPNILGCLKTRPPIPSEIKYNVDIRDSRSDGECKCCYKVVESYQLVYGHIVSYAESRNHHQDNIVLICLECNKFAGTRDMRDFQKEHYPDELPIDDYIQSMKDIEID